MAVVGMKFRAKKATKRLREIERRVSRGVPNTMKAVSLALHAEVMESFRAKRTPWGKPWRELSATTISLAARGAFGPKRKRMPTDQLEDSGMMKGGIVQDSGPHHAAVKATGPHARAAWVQQLGNKKNRLPNTKGPVGVKTKTGATYTLKPRKAPLPARPFMPLRRRGGRLVVALPRELKREVVETIKDALFGVGRAGAKGASVSLKAR